MIKADLNNEILSYITDIDRNRYKVSEEVSTGIAHLNSKEKELLQFILNNCSSEFTPIEISRQIGVTNKTVINRLAVLINNGFVIPIKVKERIRSYVLSEYTISHEKDIKKLLAQKPNTVKSNADILVKSEKLLEELILEGFSGQELLSEFKRRQTYIYQGLGNILVESKKAYKDSDFGESIRYEKVPESTDREYKKSIWDTAIGLQAVDGLKASSYLRKLADENIDGIKSYDEIDRELRKEYGTVKNRQREADIVSLRIARILEQSDFIMSSDLLVSIHEFLFKDVLEDDITGVFRDYNIMKKETILLGDTVHYADHLSIKSRLNSVLEDEKKYTYSKPMKKKDINHLSDLTSRIWQIHPFGEGNTRTTAVFIELYLKLLGIDVNKTPFKNNSDYYRNALVRSCYSSSTYNVEPTLSFLNRFYENLICGTENDLDSLICL